MPARSPPSRSGAPAQRPARRGVPSPQEVVAGVFVGGWDDAVHFEGARFCVRDDPPEGLPGAIHIPIYDDVRDAPIVPNLELLAQRIRTARDEGTPTLVFCGHGIRRGPLGVAWYLHRYAQLSLDEAYERIRAVRPTIEHARQWIGHVDGLDT